MVEFKTERFYHPKITYKGLRYPQNAVFEAKIVKEFNLVNCRWGTALSASIAAPPLSLLRNMNTFKLHIIARLPYELFSQQVPEFWHILRLVRKIWKRRTRHSHYMRRPPVPRLNRSAAADRMGHIFRPSHSVFDQNLLLSKHRCRLWTGLGKSVRRSVTLLPGFHWALHLLR